MSTEIFEIAGFRIARSDCLGLIQELTAATLSHHPPVCVDIGASDGLMYSNTLFLYMNGWRGLSLEADPEAFARMQRFYVPYLPQVQLRQTRVTPVNVCELLQQGGLAGESLPTNFDFLSLDIDSFDYDVLKALLTQYRPAVICAEINEKIPPPIRFWVPYRADHVYVGDHFYGMSLAALSDLAGQNGYDLVRLRFNNALLIAREKNIWPVQTMEEAYLTGCRIVEMPDYNLNMAPLLTMSAAEGLEFIQSHFAAYRGRYICYAPGESGSEPQARRASSQ